MGTEVQLEPGGPGQFDVLVDGERVATRSRKFWERLFGGGFPDPNAVVEAIRAQGGSG